MSDNLLDLKALQDQMVSVNKQIEELKRANTETSKQVFHGAIKAFFKQFPEVAAIKWQQYTPYFNDGDACEFRVHELNFLSAADVEEEPDDMYEHDPFAKPDEWTYNNVEKYPHYRKEIDAYEKLEKELGPRLKEVQDGIKEFRKLFNQIDEDTMESLFGDHVQITATANGIDVDEYDHE